MKTIINYFRTFKRIKELEYEKETLIGVIVSLKSTLAEKNILIAGAGEMIGSLENEIKLLKAEIVKNNIQVYVSSMKLDK